MVDFREEVGETLQAMQEIRRSTRNPQRNLLYYRRYYGTAIGDKWICVVIKILSDEAFVQTVYATDRIKRGELVWPI